MVTQTMEICIQGISAAFYFMQFLWDKLGVGFWVLGAFMIFTIYRLLIRPVIGSAISSGASDTVKSIKKTKEKGGGK